MDWRRCAAVAACLVWLAGCGDDDGGGGTADAGGSDDGGPRPDAGNGDPPGLDWTSCYGRLRCTTVEVPQDYATPDGPTQSIALVRAPARRPAERIGVMLFNPGGPGGPGKLALGENYTMLALLVPDVADRFDWIGFDPRGIGESTPTIECLSDAELDAVRSTVDFTPDDATETMALDDLVTQIAAGCRMHHDDAFLGSIHTENVARDMDTIREALGEERIHYLGVSYGTFLGATYMTLFPDRVGAFVLDSGVEPDGERLTRMRLQTAGYEDALERFFAWCAGDATCAFRADGTVDGIRAAWDALASAIDAAPIPGGARMAHEADLGAAALQALRAGRGSWNDLADALAAARDGDATALLVLADLSLFRDETGSYGNFLESFVSIYALDFTYPAGYDTAMFDALVAGEIEAAAPRMGGFISTLDRFAVGWPVARQGTMTPIAAPTAPPALIIGGTHDPATPHAESVMLQAALGNGSHLITNDGDGHGQVGIGTCALEAAVGFLLDPATPPATTDCP